MVNVMNRETEFVTMTNCFNIHYSIVGNPQLDRIGDVKASYKEFEKLCVIKAKGPDKIIAGTEALRFPYVFTPTDTIIAGNGY